MVRVLKSALVFFILGALLALVSPYLGAMIGLSPTVDGAKGELGRMGDPLLVGLFFAGLGAFDACLKPVFKKLFRSSPEREKIPK